MSTSDIIRKFKSFSNTNCPLSKGFGRLYENKEGNREISFKIPKNFGSGICSRTILNRDLEVYYNDIMTKRDIKMAGKTKGKVFILALCTGESMEWVESKSKVELQMNTGQGILYEIDNVMEVCQYISNRQYKGLGIIIKPGRFTELVSSSSFSEGIFNRNYKNFKINKFTLPIESEIIIRQIVHCSYGSNIKNIYLEGKVIELFSICLNRITEKSMDNIGNIKLSKTEVQSLYEAKEILDNSISSPTTLNTLSKLVCLNEFKLKNGFKEVFGKPVYTYLLDKRMELARLFLETRHTRVSEVAEMVGYSSSSSFSKAFRKRYGFNPSDCFDSEKNLRKRY